MYEATLKVIESNSFEYPIGAEFEGMVAQVPRKDMIFFMYLNDKNPQNGKRYAYLDDIHNVRFVDDEFVIYSDEGVFSLKLKELTSEQNSLVYRPQSPVIVQGWLEI